MTSDVRSVGRRIAQLRKARGLTQEAFAERVGLSYRHFQEIEGGRSDARVGTLLRIAQALDVPPAMLFNGQSRALGKPTADFYRQILEQVPYGVQINDANGVITYSNPAHRALHGYAAREMIGKLHIWDLAATERERQDLKAYFPTLCQGRAKVMPYFTRNRRKDGSIVEVRVDWRYLFDGDGNVVGFISGIVPAIENRPGRKPSRAVEARA